jgi:translation elongation factor EF-Tu-like GTPase
MFRMIVEDVFNDGLIVTVTAIEAFRKKMAQANPGDNVGLVLPTSNAASSAQATC